MILAVHVQTVATALGPVTLAAGPAGLLRSSLPGGAAERVLAWVRRHVPDALIEAGEAHTREAATAVQAFLAGERRDLDVPLDLRGSPFQLDVWRALREVPYGTTESYAMLAERAGHPGAHRATGAANGANPAPLFVPCHRIVASDGSLGGFTGGRAIKERLLALEQGQRWLLGEGS